MSAARVAALNERAKMLAFVLEVRPNDRVIARRLQIVETRLAVERGKLSRESLHARK